MRLRALPILVGLFLAAPVLRADLPGTVSVEIDGAPLDGLLGYRVDFTHQDVNRTDSRRLGIPYSPDQRLLTLTVTQKGLNRLQDWLNAAGGGGTPPAKTVVLIAKDATGSVLVRWQLTGVVPVTLSSAAAGAVNEVDTTVEFNFDGLQILEARAS